MVLTSLIVVAGFSVLMLSRFSMVVDLGLLTALTKLYCLVADLFVLPSLLMLRRTRASESSRDPVPVQSPVQFER